jgi:hypothetical protein
MIQALLNTRPNTWPAEPLDPSKPYKWMTRRVVDRTGGIGPITEFGESNTPGYKWHFRDKHLRWHDVNDVIPPYQKGDVLWVRETWRCMGFDDADPGETKKILVQYKDETSRWVDFDNVARWGKYAVCWAGWRPSIHMPREAARITLKVKSVRVERLQEISKEDVRAEGWPEFYIWGGQRMEYLGPYCDSSSYSAQEHKVCSPDFCHSQDCYSAFWNKLNAKRGYSWESNPYVYVYEFMRVT